MKVFFLLAGLALLWMACWPLAIFVALLFALFQLIALPFRLAGLALFATFAVLRGLVLLPARLLGWRPSRY